MIQSMFQEQFDALPKPIQDEVTYALHAPGRRSQRLTPAARAYIEALHHHARTGPKAVNALFQRDWDDLMDGRPHLLDIHEDKYPGSVASLRTKCYREAIARGLVAKTATGPLPHQLIVQAQDRIPPSNAHDAQQNAPWYRSEATPEQLAIALVPPVPDPVAPRTDVLQRVRDGLMSLPTDSAVEFITTPQAPSLPQRQAADTTDPLVRAADAIARGDIQYLAPVACSCGADPGGHPHAPGCSVWG